MTSGRTFLVTGAGRDIGLAVTQRLVAPGAFGLLHYTNSRSGIDETLTLLRDAGGDGVALQADFTSDADVTAFVAAAHDALESRALDTIVLNAAVTAATPSGQAPLEMLRAMLAANVLAPQRIVDALTPQLADGAAIVAMSIAAVRQVFSPDFAFFAATKSAVDVLVRGWAVGLGPRGIRVNAVAPGIVDANFRADLLKDDGFRTALEADTALGRAGRIDDIADAVAFLLSEQARWITGQVIDTSGGWKL